MKTVAGSWHFGVLRSTQQDAFSQKAFSIVVLLAFCVALFVTADRSGGFWWYDSASHAFNGIFLLDFLRDGGFRHPLEWAVRYFDKYPAVTLGFYPPGFAILLLPFYWLFGPSQAAAQALVAFAAFMMGLGVVRLGRQCGWEFAPALAAGVVLLTFPEMIVWERQIQPEIPAFALVIWGCSLFLDWFHRDGKASLYGAVILLVAALYVKQTILFVLPVLALLVITRFGIRIFRKRDLLYATGLGFILLLPLVAMTVVFGGFNVSQTMRAPVQQGAFFYLWALPPQIGLVPLLAAFFGAAILARKAEIPGEARLLLFGWIGVGLLFFSLIAIKESRHSSAVLPPIALFATLPFNYYPMRGVGALALVAACSLGVFNLYEFPSPIATGFREAASSVAHAAPTDSSVLLLAHRSSNFIFDLRAYENRPDLRVVRAEKLLTRYAVDRSFGITDKEFDQASILQLLDTNDVATLAIERNFWRDLPSVGRLHEALTTEPFERVASIRLLTLYRDEKAGTMDIYRRTDYTPRQSPAVTIDVPLIGLHATVPTTPGD